MAAVPTIVNCGGYCPRCFQFNDRAWSGRAAAALDYGYGYGYNMVVDWIVDNIKH